MSNTDWKLLAVFLLMELALLGFGVALSDNSTEKKEVKMVQSITDIEQDARIEQLEKEIRLLKTDLYIIQNGIEENEDAE